MHEYSISGIKVSKHSICIVSVRWHRILQYKTPFLENYLHKRAKRGRIQTQDKDKGCSRKNINYSAVNLQLNQRDNTVTKLLSNWQSCFLCIGAFGIDQKGQDKGYQSMDTDEDFMFKENGDAEELVDPIEVEVLEGKLEEVFGLKKEDPHVEQNKAVSAEHKGFVKEYSTSDLHNNISGYENKDNTNHGNKIYPLQDRSLVKKVLKWKKKGVLHRLKQWVMKMLKIHQEVTADLPANGVIGCLNVSKTFVKASKHWELDIYDSSVDGNDSLTRGLTSELVSLKNADSEYVVLEL